MTNAWAARGAASAKSAAERAGGERSGGISHLRCGVRRALHARPEHGDGDMDNVYSRRIPRFIPDVLN